MCLWLLVLQRLMSTCCRVLMLAGSTVEPGPRNPRAVVSQAVRCCARASAFLRSAACMFTTHAVAAAHTLDCQTAGVGLVVSRRQQQHAPAPLRDAAHMPAAHNVYGLPAPRRQAPVQNAPMYTHDVSQQCGWLVLVRRRPQHSAARRPLLAVPGGAQHAKIGGNAAHIHTGRMMRR